MTLSATTIDDASRGTWDLVVIGAGPAGTIAARQGACAGLKTLLVERRSFPREKVCGGCLNLSAVGLLEQLGLESQIGALGAPTLHEFEVHCRRGRLRVPLPGGIAVTRARLDEVLAAAAVTAGALFLPDTVAEVLSERESFESEGTQAHRLIRLRSCGRQLSVRARAIIAADGLGHPSLVRLPEFGSRPRSSARIGIGATLECDSSDYGPGAIFMAVGRVGYVGVTRVENNRLNVAAALDPRGLKSHVKPQEAVETILREAGYPPLGKSAEAIVWHGTPPLTRQTPRLAGFRLLVAGDAAGYVEPFTGEGMAWALAGGAAVGPIVARGQQIWDASLEREWHREWRRLVAGRQHWCRLLALGLRSPRLTGSLLFAVSLVPQVAHSIIRRLNAPLLPAKGVVG